MSGLDATAASLVHAEVERDLDEAVLYRLTGRTVERWVPHERTLAASRTVLAAVDKVYFYVALWVFGRAVDPRTFSVAVHEFRLVQHIFDSPGGEKRRVLGALERLVTRQPFSLVRAMAHRVRAEGTSDFDNREHRGWENPFTHERSTASFWDLYDAARARALPVIDELINGAPDPEGARALTGDVNFEGAVVEPGPASGW